MLRLNVLSGLSICLIGLIAVSGLIVAAPGDTRIADAAMIGDKGAVKTLLGQAVDVNSAQGDGMTALHWAALKGDAELAQMLLYAGANIRATTRLGAYTPLYMAAKTGTAPVIDVLLKAGADAKVKAVADITPLHMAATSGNVDAVKLLLDKGADANAKEAESGQTPLSFAAAFNRADVIKLLVARGGDLNLQTKVRQPTTQQRGQIPGQQFQQGQQGQQGQQAAQPAQQGAPAPGQAQQAAGGRGGRGGRGGPPPAGAPAAGAPAAGAPTPAAQAQQVPAAPSAQQAANAQPAQPAQPGQQAQQGQQQQQQNNGGEDNARGGGNPWGAFTPLMYAARQGSFDAARTIVESGANLNLYSGDGSTALLLATINGHFDLAKYLAEKGADVRIASVDGATPLYGVVNTQWAKKSFYPQPTPRYEKTTYLDLINLFIDKGADPNAKLIKDLWFSEYNFSLSSAAQAGSTAFWKCAEVGDIEGMKLLVSRGADPNIANRDGVTALLIASGAGTHGNDDVVAPPGRLAAIKYLVEELKLDVNAKDNAPANGGRFGGGQDPAQLQERAVRIATDLNNGKAPTQEQIAEQLRILNQQQQQQGFGRGRGGGITALHNAAARGDNEMILYLVSKGAKVDAVSNAGVSVVDLANGPRQRVQPYAETVALLEILGSKNSHKCVSC